MGLNIKNPRVHALAKAVAQRTGKSQTGAIEEALECMLERLDSGDTADARKARLLRLAEEARADVDFVDSHRLQAELYDESGLPK